MSERKGLVQTVVAAVISGSVASVIVGAILKAYFEKSFEARKRDEAILTELVAPATMHFARTEVIAERYGRDSPTQKFGDADLLRESNKEVRDLLMSKGYLIPTKLMKDSQCLIAHYDIWLRRFEDKKQKFKAEHNRDPLIDDDFDVGFFETGESRYRRKAVWWIR